jgi:hypothetical protein
VKDDDSGTASRNARASRPNTMMWVLPRDVLQSKHSFGVSPFRKPNRRLHIRHGTVLAAVKKSPLPIKWFRTVRGLQALYMRRAVHIYCVVHPAFGQQAAYGKKSTQESHWTAMSEQTSGVSNARYLHAKFKGQPRSSTFLVPPMLLELLSQQATEIEKPFQDS